MAMAALLLSTALVTSAWLRAMSTMENRPLAVKSEINCRLSWVWSMSRMTVET